MGGRWLTIILKSSLVTIAVVLVSQAVSFSVRSAAGQPFTAFVFAMNSILPVLTAFPASFVIFWQNERLRQALEELLRANQRLAHQATHDHLTGLLNRNGFLEAYKLGRQKNDAGALLLVDADNFKAINDTYGHEIGDEALLRMARAIQRPLGPDDAIGRIGGEEFCVFLPGADANAAYAMAEHIRREVEAITFRSNGGTPVPLAVSIGAVVTSRPQPASRLLRQADVCLYKAKNQGRNQVVVEEASNVEIASDAREALARG